MDRREYDYIKKLFEDGSTDFYFILNYKDFSSKFKGVSFRDYVTFIKENPSMYVEASILNQEYEIEHDTESKYQILEYSDRLIKIDETKDLLRYLFTSPRMLKISDHVTLYGGRVYDVETQDMEGFALRSSEYVYDRYCEIFEIDARRALDYNIERLSGIISFNLTARPDPEFLYRIFDETPDAKWIYIESPGPYAHLPELHDYDSPETRARISEELNNMPISQGLTLCIWYQYIAPLLPGG